ncbi:MAG: hypothetical protein KDA81_10240 [Planctomycetaceae bacterium]|nr:hypothetical protein [Planctomycetaceae bacterium]
MNNLTSRQRKLVYAGCILLLLIPIVILGAPLADDVEPGTKAVVSGGTLAQMRVEYDLGESTLGEIDPSSAAMNLVLLGLRGPAAGVLHLQALDYQEKKDWAKLKTTVDSIIKLQPHYVEIWKFQGWNLAFNVSREWDKVADRFYWVKEGIKFLQLGTNRNQTATILFHNVGDFMGRKFGNSDEKKFFRRFFKNDPDTDTFDGSSDPEINPQGKDNYLVAKDWFEIANDKDANGYRIKGMTHVFARQGPSRALFDYATAMQGDGVFDEENRSAWEAAYDEWTKRYGNDIFLGLDDIKYKLNCSADELEELAKENRVPLERQRQIWEQNVKMVNYRFWQNLSECERDPLTVEAHRSIYQGKVAYSKGEISDAEDENGKLQPSRAEQLFADGLAKFEQVLQKYPTLADHDTYIDEFMLAIYYWEKVHQYNGKPIPSEFPLKGLALQNMGRQSDIEREFILENRRGL